MSVASRIQEIETHIGDIYDTLEVGGTDLTDLNKNIVNINSSLKDRYKYFLNNGVDIIWNNWEKVIGEGTEFTLENTIQAPMKINLKGNTYQKSTTGKNLCPNNLSSTTQSGVTYSVNEDGSIKITGTASARIEPNLFNDSNNPIIFEAGTYKNTSNRMIVLYADGYNVLAANSSLTLNESKTVTRIYFRIESGEANLNETYYPQIIKSGDIETYEKYTGGIASPNPEFPQDIQVVSGDNTITTSKDGFENIELESGYIDSNNVIQSATGWKHSDYIDITGYEYYVVDMNLGNTPKSILYDSNKQPIQVFSIQHQGTYNLSNYPSAKYIRISSQEVYLNKQHLIVKSDYQVNLGDIELCEIGDYQDDFIRNSGKNLFDKNDYSYYDGYISGTGTTSIVSAANNKIIYIPCLPNAQYTISKIISMRFRIGYSIDIPNADINVYGVLNNDNGTSLTITTGDDAKCLVVYLQNGNLSGEKSLEDIINSLQIEEGTQVTEYEPYGTGKWYLHKEIGKVVLDGTEDGWSKNSEVSSTNAYINPTVFVNRLSRGIAYSDYLKRITSIAGKTGIYSAVHINFCFESEDFDTLEKFKTWLQAHNMTVYYQLATPTYTEITDTTLLSQLEAVYKAISHYDQTNISQVNNDMPFKLDVTALKNI